MGVTENPDAKTLPDNSVVDNVFACNKDVVFVDMADKSYPSLVVRSVKDVEKGVSVVSIFLENIDELVSDIILDLSTLVVLKEEKLIKSTVDDGCIVVIKGSSTAEEGNVLVPAEMGFLTVMNT